MIGKNEVRQRVRELQQEFSPAWRTEQSRLTQKLLINSQDFQRAQSVGCYLACGTEVDTADIIAAALDAGKRVASPKYFKTTGAWEHVEIAGLQDVIIGEWGVPEPASDRMFGRDGLDVIIVPGMAFDRVGNRVGRGKGHYDGLLKGYCGIKIGMAFEYQLFDLLAMEVHDVPMDFVVTPRQIHRPLKNT
jgi:5-formyltetrahydrofolate cyclo-ligase